MANTLLERYRAATPDNVNVVLNDVINASPFAFDRTSRSEFIQALLADLQVVNGKITAQNAATALLALKTLGKNPTGSESLGTAPILSTLLKIVSTHKDDIEASGEGLRCIANALLLFEPARTAFISSQVKGGDVCIDLLQKSSNPDQIFILSRILFLSTVHPSQFITALVEEKRVVEVVGAKLDLLITSLLSGAKTSKEAMVDVLKFTFNVLMHYPKSLDGPSDGKVIGDSWSPKLDSILPPLLRVFHALPPTFPTPIAAPLTHAIHSLIVVPITPTLRSEWFTSSGSSSPKPTMQRTESSSSSRTHSPVRSGGPTSPTGKSSPLDRALSVLSAGRRSLSRSPSPIPPRPSPKDTLLRAHSLLEVAFTHYFPEMTEPDDLSVRDKVKSESTLSPPAESLDDELSPLVVLITRLCNADENSRTRTRDWLCPADLDRSAAAGSLESRPDMLGRCLRLLGSVYHARLKDSVGEMLYAMCDSDVSTMSTLLGYGNVAGFLFNKGIMTAPPPSTSTSPSTAAALAAASSPSINPITGTTNAPREPEPEMTQEEKEREMEKLFVLFDRLERTGALPKEQNPIRKAMEKAATAPPPPPNDNDD
ncbi:hypothetical protein MIND_00677000 [Mycena indigotica]|uniref:Guanine nucleotide exchange factor n=1 Tax=Mycena indigotica TaxID=2126181 RepID=A0A8H6W475_9AGAR|nr:uncharacterized protein MIND_00677000 [Mycena indigotica]KAF7301128.1 hypothetical protein MIND_00677000 [Mycena indigotica]